jgi:hypothetical protein
MWHPSRDGASAMVAAVVAIVAMTLASDHALAAPSEPDAAATMTDGAPGESRAGVPPRATAAAPASPFARAFAPAPLGVVAIEDPVLMARITGHGGPVRGALNAERAKVMLQSLTLPGWGQLTTGHPRAARVFGVIDAGIWASFVAFEVQQHLRTDAAIRTAREFAGIDLSGRSEEFRRIVGSYPSSDDYNVLVVFRDAANLYYNDPAAYRAYIAQHQIGGAQSWSWTDPESFDRYRAQRKDAQRAGLRANTALALAIANRLVSAVHAAGVGGRKPPAGHSLRFEVTPDFSQGPVAVRFGLGASF